MKISKAKAKSVLVAFGVALLAKVGLEKANEWAATQGDTAEKVAAGLSMLGGAAAQFSKSEIVQAAGIVGIGVGGHNLINSFITDEAGNVKPDSISQAIANATLPQNTAMNGLSGMLGMGNTESYTEPAVYQTQGSVASMLVGQ